VFGIKLEDIKHLGPSNTGNPPYFSNSAKCGVHKEVFYWLKSAFLLLSQKLPSWLWFFFTLYEPERL